MFELKKISHAAVPGALAKAERYRLLNEPEQAESICRDVLAVAPDNESAAVTLLLALTDQFRVRSATGIREAEEALGRIREPYARAYYGAIIRERWALAILADGDLERVRAPHRQPRAARRERARPHRRRRRRAAPTVITGLRRQNAASPRARLPTTATGG